MPRRSHGHRSWHFDVPLPSLDQQRRIVDLLSRAEGIVRLRREAQAKAAEIIPGAFPRHVRRLPPTNTTDVLTVGDLITKWTTPQSGTPVLIQPMRLFRYWLLPHHRRCRAGQILFESLSTWRRDEPKTAEQLQARSAVYPQDVLMNIVGPPLGRICLVPGTFPQWNVNQALAIFRVRDEILPHFLFSALRSPLVLPGILRLPVGVRQLNISLEQCRNIRVSFRANDQRAARLC